MMFPDPASEPLPKKVWIKHYDYLYLHGRLNSEILEHMDKWQQSAVRELMRCQNRIRLRGIPGEGEEDDL